MSNSAISISLSPFPFLLFFPLLSLSSDSLSACLFQDFDFSVDKQLCFSFLHTTSIWHRLLQKITSQNIACHSLSHTERGNKERHFVETRREAEWGMCSLLRVLYACVVCVCVVCVCVCGVCGVCVCVNVWMQDLLGNKACVKVSVKETESVRQR